MFASKQTCLHYTLNPNNQTHNIPIIYFPLKTSRKTEPRNNSGRPPGTSLTILRIPVAIPLYSHITILKTRPAEWRIGLIIKGVIIRAIKATWFPYTLYRRYCCLLLLTVAAATLPRRHYQSSRLTTPVRVNLPFIVPYMIFPCVFRVRKSGPEVILIGQTLLVTSTWLSIIFHCAFTPYEQI